MKKSRVKRTAFMINIMGHRIRVNVQKTPPNWVIKKYKDADGAWHVNRKRGLRIWVRASDDQMLVEDVFLHECGHATWHNLFQYREESSWSESVSDVIADIYWELEKGLKKIRELYGKA